MWFPYTFCLITSCLRHLLLLVPPSDTKPPRHNTISSYIKDPMYKELQNFGQLLNSYSK